MKKIDISQIVSPTSKQPFTANSLKFKQDYDVENYSALVKALITQSTGSYSLTTPYVISGCVLSDSNKDVTAGEIFYGGNFYNVTALNGTTNIVQFILTKTYDPTADPLTFTDGVVKNVHEIYTYVSTDAASGGDFDATDLVNLYGTTTINTSTSAQTTIDFSITAGGPVTYDTDSYYYSWYIEKGICFLNFKTIFTITDGGTVDKIHIPLPTGVTKATTLTEDNCFRGNASFNAPSGTTDYILMQVNSNDGGGEGQRITLKRYSDGAITVGLSTVVTTIRGSIQFPIV